MIERIVANGHGALRDPKYLAIHSTANPGASAANHVRYWTNNPTYAVHAVSDWKEAYHTVPWDRLCYQVGNGNSTCIGIEICEATTYQDFMRGMEIARDAIWEMLDMKGWGVDRLRSHDWFRINYGGTDHTDPIPYLKKYGKDWNWFVDFVSQRKAQNVSRPVQMWHSNGTDAQRFIPEWHDDGTCTLVNIRFGLALDVMSAGTTSGTAVWAHTPNGTVAQKWRIIPIENKYSLVEIAPMTNDKLRLDVKDGSTEEGASLQIWEAHGGNNQKWLVADRGDGTWELINNGNGAKLAIDLPW